MLRIPSQCPSGFLGRYTVVPGDSMWLIAQSFAVSPQALVQANPHITEPRLIFPGDVLCVPDLRRYIVQPSIPPVSPSPQAVATAELALDIWDQQTAVIMVAVAGAVSAWEPTIGGNIPRILFQIQSPFAEDALRYNCPLGDLDGPASWGLWQIFMPLHAQFRVNNQLVPSEDSLLGLLGAPIDDPCQTAQWLRTPVNNALTAAAILELLGFQAWTAFANGAFKAFLPGAEAAVQAVKSGR